MAKPKLVDNTLTTFRIVSRHAQWRLWIMVVTWLAVVVIGAEQYLHWYTIHQIIPEETEVDNFGVVHQSTDFTCVPAAFTTLLLQQGHQVDQREITDQLGTTIFGTYPWLIPTVGRRHGYRVTREHLDFDGLVTSAEPLLIHNRFSEGLHVSYIPPGRMDDDFAQLLFPGIEEPLLPVMDPVDGLVLMDRDGFADFFDGAGTKEVYRFTPRDGTPQPLDLRGIFLTGNIPLLKIDE